MHQRGGCYAQQAGYEASGAPDHWTLGNGLVQNWMYDAANRPIRLQLGSDATVDEENDSLSAPAATVFDRQYAFDGVGNISSLTDKRGVVALQTYSYDDRDRLTGWTLGGTTETYIYNTIGNLTSKAGVPQNYGSTGSSTGTGPHQVRSVGGSTYNYDANGNLTSGGGRVITWTSSNKPYTVTSGGNTELYVYNANDARIKKVRNGVSTYYLEGFWEEDSTGVVRKYYSISGKPVAMREITSMGSVIIYLQGDHLGSVSLTIDHSGSTSLSQEFDPWGKVRSGEISQTDRNFTGQYLDDTGLLFYNARYYDPIIGRFIAADTIAPSRTNIETRNRYTYVLNNPLRFNDPSGHCAPWSGDDPAQCKEVTNDLAALGVSVDNLWNWSFADLNSILDALLLFLERTGWTDDTFKEKMGPVTIKRSYSRPQATIFGGETLARVDANWLNGSTITFYDGAFDPGKITKVTIHEFAHVWDNNSNNDLSRDMEKATGSKTTCQLLIFCTYQPGGSPASNYGGTNAREDWAEAVTGFILPEEPDYQNPDGSRRMDDARYNYVKEQLQ